MYNIILLYYYNLNVYLNVSGLGALYESPKKVHSRYAEVCGIQAASGW